MENNCCKGGGGPGYATPMDAYKLGPREKLLYVTAISPPNEDGKYKFPDYVATIDVDPSSLTYSQVIHRTEFPNLGDEVHHTGWNTCSSCYDNPNENRQYLVVPCLGSDRIYFIDTFKDPKKPTLVHTIEGDELHALGVTQPHTSHCLPNGEIMISTMGKYPEYTAEGNFIFIDSKTLKLKGKSSDSAPFGYDFWYQPFHNVLFSTEWGAPKFFKQGFNPEHLANAKGYGRHINIYDWSTRKIMDKLDLGEEGLMPLEIRFLHNPRSSVGYVGCALTSNIFKFYKNDDQKWVTKKVIDVPSVKVENWALPEMPGVITDILISMDDKYLYFSNWVQGDIRQYDISGENPVLTGRINLGGSLIKEGPVKIKDATKAEKSGASVELVDPIFVKNKRIYGGPQMIQLSLDGKRLYVTNSLFSPWDKQFYPDMIKNGSAMLQIDVDTENGGMKINPNFVVDFGNEPNGPSLAHEVRYPGGDCSSDIYLVELEKFSKLK